MISVVASGISSFNNKIVYSNNFLLRNLKLIYYKWFSYLYGFVGRFAHLVIVNSTWTKQHIDYIWKAAHKTFIVYPPCDTLSMKSFHLDKRNNDIVSVSQFRPEKNQEMQLRVFELFIKQNPSNRSKLIIIGSCRNDEDIDRVNKLKEMAESLGIQVCFRIH